LSKASVFVEQAERLLGLDARLTLVERMAFARGVSGKLMTELGELLSRTRKLHEQRDEVARALALLDSESTVPPVDQTAPKVKPPRKRGADFARLAELKTLWTPSLSQIESHSIEAIELQNGLRALAEKLDHYLAAAPAVTNL
jgi:hypothetical protein